MCPGRSTNEYQNQGWKGCWNGTVWTYELASLIGTQRADFIKASGNINRIKRPDGAVKLMRTLIRLLAQPKSMRSIIDATQREQRCGSAWNWCVNRDGVADWNGSELKRGWRRISARLPFVEILASPSLVAWTVSENSQLCCLPSDLFLAGQHFLWSSSLRGRNAVCPLL